METGSPQLCRTSAGISPLRLSLIKHCRDLGSRENVVELLKQQHLPVPPLRGFSPEGLHQISLPQQPLQGAVVSFLIRARGGTAPVQFQVQLVLPDG